MVQRWAATRDDCLWLRRMEPFRACRIADVVRRLRIDPQAGGIEATVTDGVDAVVARWTIRGMASRARPSPGHGVILEGVPTVLADGGMLMTEPDFEILTGPGME